MNFKSNRVYTTDCANSNNIPLFSFYLRIFSLLVNIIFFVDLGFVSLSLRYSKVLNSLRLFVATFISVFFCYVSFARYPTDLAIEKSISVISFYINVVIFMKSIMSTFYFNMIKFDSILNIKFPRRFFFILVCVISVILPLKMALNYFRCINIFSYCTMSLLENIMMYVIIPHNYILRITFVFVCFSIYYRLKFLTCKVKISHNFEYSQHVYRSFLDASEKMVNNFDWMVSHFRQRLNYTYNSILF